MTKYYQWTENTIFIGTEGRPLKIVENYLKEEKFRFRVQNNHCLKYGFKDEAEILKWFDEHFQDRWTAVYNAEGTSINYFYFQSKSDALIFILKVDGENIVEEL